MLCAVAFFDVARWRHVFRWWHYFCSFEAVFLKLCASRSSQVCRKRFRKKISRESNFADFARGTGQIRSGDRFSLERMDFGKEINRRERKRFFLFFFQRIACCGENEEIRAENCGESAFYCFIFGENLNFEMKSRKSVHKNR